MFTIKNLHLLCQNLLYKITKIKKTIIMKIIMVLPHHNNYKILLKIIRKQNNKIIS